MKQEFDTPRLHKLNDTVPAFDEDGNHYTRKIRTGLKRGEFFVKETFSESGVTSYLLVQKAKPVSLNLYNTETRERVQHPLKPGVTLCWLLTEEAYREALKILDTR